MGNVGRKALFVDRDGVVNEDRGYVHRAEDFVVLPGVIDALRLAREFGYLVVVVTNQAGIARGYYGLEAVDELHRHMVALFASQGVSVDGIYICPHHVMGIMPEYAVACECRKPRPGMILRAARDLDVDVAESLLVGDKPSDIEAGLAACVGKNCLIRKSSAASSIPAGLPYLECQSLYEAVFRYCVDSRLVR